MMHHWRGSSLRGMLSTPTPGRSRESMQFRRSDFADLSYFLEIARHRNFRRAGLELGISASAVGAGSIGYQWYFSPDDNNDYQPLAGGADSSYAINGAQTNNAGYYYLVAANDYGSAASSTAHLTVLYNGASSAPYLWLLGHNPSGDSIMIALESGRNYRVQASTDLLTWTDVTNFLSHSSLVSFTNSAFSGLPAMYYRVVTP